MMTVGYAVRDITPRPGLTLSGFAARRNQPSRGADDPLFVRALAIQEGKSPPFLLLSFDLLGLGAEMDTLMHAALDAHIHVPLPRENRVFCATHTHSGPSVIRLLGCGIADSGYWRRVVSAGMLAAEEATESMKPATFRAVTVPVKGVAYNRRQVLRDGRVVMGRAAPETVQEQGPVIEEMLLGRFDDAEKKGIAGFILGAIHADTVCSLHATADFPGELCRGLSQEHGFPFLYLAGAGANVNPIMGQMDRPQMRANAEAMLSQLRKAKWPVRGSTDFRGPARATVGLEYGRLPSPAFLEKMRTGMNAIAHSGLGPDDMMGVLGNILNVKAGEWPDKEMARHIAGTLAEWSAHTLTKMKAGRKAMSCDLSTAAVRIGRTALVFVAAEPFTETQVALEKEAGAASVHIVGYASPLVGYLPTDKALEQGGYEVEDAYRFYDHPAAFARGSERAFLAAAKGLIRSLART